MRKVIDGIRRAGTGPLTGVALAALTCVVVARPGAAETPSLAVSPRKVEVGTFTPGAALRLTGQVRSGSSVVLTVRGPDVTEVFNRKGRFGFIWVNSGKVEVSGVPALFLSFTQQPLEGALARAVIDEFALDERAVARRMRITPPDADRQVVRDDYLRLKVDDGSYRTMIGGVEVTGAGAGRADYAVQFAWPTTGPPGTYRAEAFECRDGSVVGSTASSFDVVESGFAAGMKQLADDHGALYGALAVGVTMSLGFGLDQVLARVRRRAAARRRRVDAPVRKNIAVH